jgi:hypothetical protein
MPEQDQLIREWIMQRLGSACGACGADSSVTPRRVLAPVALARPRPDPTYLTCMSPLLLVIPLVCPRCAHVQFFDAGGIPGLDAQLLAEYAP